MDNGDYSHLVTCNVMTKTNVNFNLAIFIITGVQNHFSASESVETAIPKSSQLHETYQAIEERRAFRR